VSNFDWIKVVFTDESTFKLNQNTGKAWRFPWMRKVSQSVKHPLKVNVWGCFSVKGFGSIICFARNLDGTYMCTLYGKGLLPSTAAFFPDGDD
jgi:hypothetical protein